MSTHYFIIIGIIFLVGSLAGLTNFLDFYFKDLIKSKYEIFKYLISGIGAAILVPLLLNMLSSNLIKETDGFDKLNYFVFAGFCFIAGYFSDRFISSIGDKILKDLERTKDKVDKVISSTKENEEKIDFIVSTDAEVDDAEIESKIDLGDLKVQTNFTDDNFNTQIEKIIKSYSGKYKFRTAKGIARDLNYNEIVTEKILESLQNQGLAKKITNSHGLVFWALTKMGSSMANIEKVIEADSK